MKYQRATHDKEFKYVYQSVNQKKEDDCWSKYGLIGHMCSSIRPYTEEEIFNFVNKYNAQYNEPLYEVKFVRKGLLELVKNRFIKTVD